MAKQKRSTSEIKAAIEKDIVEQRRRGSTKTRDLTLKDQEWVIREAQRKAKAEAEVKAKEQALFLQRQAEEKARGIIASRKAEEEESKAEAKAKRLEGFEQRVERIKQTEVAHAERVQKAEDIYKLVPGLGGEGFFQKLGRGALNLPFAMTVGFAGTVGVASQKLMSATEGLMMEETRGQVIRELRGAAKKTPSAVRETYIHKSPETGKYSITPQNILNIATTSVMVKLGGAARVKTRSYTPKGKYKGEGVKTTFKGGKEVITERASFIAKSGGKVKVKREFTPSKKPTAKLDLDVKTTLTRTTGKPIVIKSRGKIVHAETKTGAFVSKTTIKPRFGKATTEVTVGQVMRGTTKKIGVLKTTTPTVTVAKFTRIGKGRAVRGRIVQHSEVIIQESIHPVKTVGSERLGTIRRVGGQRIKKNPFVYEKIYSTDIKIHPSKTRQLSSQFFKSRRGETGVLSKPTTRPFKIDTGFPSSIKPKSIGILSLKVKDLARPAMPKTFGGSRIRPVITTKPVVLVQPVSKIGTVLPSRIKPTVFPSKRSKPFDITKGVTEPTPEPIGMTEPTPEPISEPVPSIGGDTTINIFRSRKTTRVTPTTNFFAATTPRVKPKGIGIIPIPTGIGRGGIGAYKPKRRVSVRQAKAYKPSLTASILGLKGRTRKKGIFTGLELRGL